MPEISRFQPHRCECICSLLSIPVRVHRGALFTRQNKLFEDVTLEIVMVFFFFPSAASQFKP